jgi:hypothetical protein
MADDNETTSQWQMPPNNQPHQSGPPNRDVPDYLVWSVLLMVFCCQPFGIISTIFSAMALSNRDTGNIDAALHNAAQAKKFLKLGFFIGLAVWVLFAIFYATMFAIGFAGEAMNTSP